MNKLKQESVVATTLSFTITLTTFKDGTLKLHRVNDGFTAIDLLGVLDLIACEIRQQMTGGIKADIIKRDFIV